VAVAQEIRVRLIDIETGRPAKSQYVELVFGKGKLKPTVSPSVVATAGVSHVGVLTGDDGVAGFSVPARVSLESGEISVVRVHAANYSSLLEDGRYVSCADEALLQTEEVLRSGITVKNVSPWCRDKKAPGVKATPGEIIVFVRSLAAMAGAEIRVRLIDIETGKPVKGQPVEVTAVKGREVQLKPAVPPSIMQTSWAPQSRVRVPTSIDGVARVRVPAPESRDTRDINLISVHAAGYPIISCASESQFRTQEILRYGITAKETMSWCPDKKALDEVEARPGELVIFVRSLTWRERIRHWFSDS
jgi:hypothetical protein